MMNRRHAEPPAGSGSHTVLERLVSLYSEVLPCYSPVSRRTFNRWVLMLPGAGCEYWKRTGGCSMCGFHNATQQYTGGRLYSAPIFNLMRWLGEKAHTKTRPAELAVFIGGSFWNGRELPVRAQERVYAAVARHSSLDTLMIETRCEHVTESKLDSALRGLDGKTLRVGIGLESQDDRIRNELIGKGLAREAFERKVSLLRAHGAQVLAYVFLKPVGLGERSAVIESLETIRYALSIGVTEVELSCAFVQKNTPMAELFARGEYRPPWLWSVLEVIRESQRQKWPLTVGRFTDEPRPLAVPENCSECTARTNEAIEGFRRTGDLAPTPDCDCRQSWEQQMIP